MKKQLMVTAVASSLVLGGCASSGTNNSAQTIAQNKAVIGALAGAALGAAVSKASGGDETGRDALIGAAIGGGVGYYMQQQAQRMQSDMAGTGVVVELDPRTNNIDIVMPSNITFDVNKADIKSSFTGTLQQLANTMQQYNQTSVIVKGHTDSDGSDSYNQNLSEKRAYSVASYLNNNGVAASRISTIGYGETMPVASNSTAAGKAQNRRVELQIIAPESVK